MPGCGQVRLGPLLALVAIADQGPAERGPSPLPGDLGPGSTGLALLPTAQREEPWVFSRRLRDSWLGKSPVLRRRLPLRW